MLNPILNLKNLEENMIIVEGGIMEIQKVRIELTDFMICRFPVSQQLWLELIGDISSQPSGTNPGMPVVNVSWSDIHSKFFPAIRTKFQGLSWCLPTEAQWEYAARGGRYPLRNFIYAGSDEIDEVSWYEGNSFQELYQPGF